MAKPKKRKGLPKTTAEWEAQSTEDVIRHVFGKQGQQTLQGQAVAKDRKPKPDKGLPA